MVYACITHNSNKWHNLYHDQVAECLANNANRSDSKVQKLNYEIYTTCMKIMVSWSIPKWKDMAKIKQINPWEITN